MGLKDDLTGKAKEAEGKVGAPIKITGYVRYKLGEGVENDEHHRLDRDPSEDVADRDAHLAGPGGSAGIENAASAADPGLSPADTSKLQSALRAVTNPLTARERDVLASAEGGTTIADIAARLFLSESTVRNYLSAAIGKTGTRNKTEAALAARDHGWL